MIKKIYDNEGESFDRYSVIYSDGSFLGLSHNPQSPQGFSQWSFAGNYIDGPHLGKQIEFDDLPKDVKNHLNSIEKNWKDMENF